MRPPPLYFNNAISQNFTAFFLHAIFSMKSVVLVKYFRESPDCEIYEANFIFLLLLGCFGTLTEEIFHAVFFWHLVSFDLCGNRIFGQFGCVWCMYVYFCARGTLTQASAECDGAKWNLQQLGTQSAHMFEWLADTLTKNELKSKGNFGVRCRFSH